MNAMKDAIRAKRLGEEPKGLMSESLAVAKEEPEQEGKSLNDLVATLSDDDKKQLMLLLKQDMAPQGAKEIANGAPSSEEQMIVDEKATIEGAEGDEDQTDEIGKSMLETRFKNQNANSNQAPRNLGERVQMSIRDRLKGKGKI
jgi:hypothetical protein